MTIFESKPRNNGKGDNKPKALTPEEVEQITRTAVNDAVDFDESEIAPKREVADMYYQGGTKVKHVKGRSEIVVTKVRDGVKSVVPSLARIFTQTDNIVEFTSDDEEDQKICREATLYCNRIYHKHDGYTAVIEASTDALKARIGVIGVSVEDKQIVAHKNHKIVEGVTPADLGGGVVTEASDTEQVITRKLTRRVWTLKAIPPEEFFVNAGAKSIDDAFICGHRRGETISDLVEMGFDYDQLKDLPEWSPDTDEDDSRKGHSHDGEEGKSTAIDISTKTVLFTEAYIRIDADGDGIAELRRVCLGGDGYKLLTDEPVNYASYAVFKADLQPHVFHPICLAEDLQQDQDAQTAMMRGIIDNTALGNNPRTVVNETQVNVDDVKNGAIGAIIRAKSMGQIEELVTPNQAGTALTVLQHMESVSEQRSGITRLSQGLDADALQSTTKIAATAAVLGADARQEMMARNIAETGLKSLFKCILRLAIDSGGIHSIKLPEGFVNVEPALWHTQLEIKTNVGLGSGRIDEKKQVFTSVLPLQQMIVEKYGPANPICSWNNLRNTIKSAMRLSGIHNCEDYFPYIPEDKLAELDKQMKEQAAAADKKMQQAQQLQQDAMNQLVKVEVERVKNNYEIRIAEITSRHQQEINKLQAQLAESEKRFTLDMTKVYMEDDRIRDKNDMDFAVDVAKVGVDEKKVKATEAKVNAPRNGALNG